MTTLENFNLVDYLPFLIPLIVIELGLMIAALVHILTHQHYRMGNRVLWIVVCVLVNIIGPILYFCVGRDDQGGDRGDRDSGGARGIGSGDLHDSQRDDQSRGV